MMVARHHDVLLHRHASNPILTAAAWPYAVHTVFN
ncbi:MAG: glycosidase, partial [Gemmatimonadetes bacterium]|nr:glycosidase [Gemmatimonadota bacterium]